MLKNKCLIESKRGIVMEIKKSGSFYVTACLAVVMAPTVLETVEKDERKVTHATVADAPNLYQKRFGHLGTKPLLPRPRSKLCWEYRSLKRITVTSICPGCVLEKFDRKPF